MASTTAKELEPGDCAFYGVRPAWAHLWEQAKRERRNWYYLDNSWFDSTRERYFRVSKCRIQHSGNEARSDGSRFRALGLRVAPWKRGGDYTLVCAQSDEFMQTVAGCPDWLESTLRRLDRTCERYILRTKGANRPFSFDLDHARKLITWSSAAAVMALINGVPVECSDQCAAYGVTDRQRWAEVLADNQWTLDEIRRGDAWRALEG